MLLTKEDQYEFKEYVRRTVRDVIRCHIGDSIFIDDSIWITNHIHIWNVMNSVNRSILRRLNNATN